MKRRITAIMAFLMCAFFMLVSANPLSAESKTASSSDYDSKAKIIGVGGTGHKEYTYIDMGAAHGIKPGDRFMVKGKKRPGVV